MLSSFYVCTPFIRSFTSLITFIFQYKLKAEVLLPIFQIWNLESESLSNLARTSRTLQHDS